VSRSPSHYASQLARVSLLFTARPVLRSDTRDGRKALFPAFSAIPAFSAFLRCFLFHI
jgi:hypothetical protein